MLPTAIQMRTREVLALHNDLQVRFSASNGGGGLRVLNRDDLTILT